MFALNYKVDCNMIQKFVNISAQCGKQTSVLDTWTAAIYNGANL